MKNQQYKNFFKFIFFILFGLFLIGGLIYATNVFPTDENDWSDGEVIESDWANQLEYRIGANATTSKSTLTYQVNTLMGTTSLPLLSTIGTIISGIWQGTAVGDAYLTKSGDWTGTLDTYNGSDLLARTNHTGTQNISTLSNYDWTFSNNYGAINLTGSSTKPIWAQGGINASSTSNFVYASTTALTVSGNSYLGTISSGTWNGTAIGNSYLDDDITLTNLTQITNRAITDTTGTLTVARGGTGQTSFGQGWLNSDGTTLTSSTSPTVAYIVATSTTATSTFAGGLKSDKAVQFPSFANCNIDTDADGFLVCGSDSTGSAVGTVSTSSTPTIGNLAYWTSADYPSLLGTVATSTIGAGTGLAFSGTSGYQVGGTNGTFSVNTSQNIATLSNLTSNGFVKTSGGVGTLSVDTNTYLTTVDISANTNLASTWPVILTGDTLSFNGLSTSTAPTIGNLPYFSGVNTFANIATTTLTGTAPMVFSAPISVIGGSASVLTCTVANGSVAGCLSVANWNDFNNKAETSSQMTGQFDGNDFAGEAIGVGQLIYGGSAGSFSELAISTNGYVLALSGGLPTWVATTTLSTISGTLDISSQSNLTAGTNITLTNDDLSVDDAFLLNTGDIGTGVYDLGGATSLEIPNGASPTVDTTGELGVDTTSDQLVYYGASEKKQIVPFYTTGFSYATTSFVGTTTIFMAPAMAAQTWKTAKCETSVGTLNVVVNDGTNYSNLLNASTTIGTLTLSSNNAFTSSETIRVDVGTPASSPVKIACRFKFVYDAD